MNYIGQQFIYQHSKPTESPKTEYVTLLICGYIREMENILFIKLIPDDIKNLTEQFCGKKYYISGPSPFLI